MHETGLVRLHPLAPAALAIALTGPALTACGGSVGPATKATGDVIISGYAYSPATLTVAPRQTLTVVNRDRVTHDLSSDRRGLFGVAALGGGKSGTFTAPSTPGTYSYFCSFHPDMHGTLTVR